MANGSIEKENMRKIIYFDKFDQNSWPDASELEPYFLAPKGQRWSFQGGNDHWGLSVEGLNDTEHLDIGDRSRADIHLEMVGHSEFGVLLYYQKVGGGFDEVFTSKNDLGRLKEWARTLQSDLWPIGLFIPFDKAWFAVKEFMETEGDLPKSIEWVENSTLPEGTFPLPHEKVDGPVY